MVVVETDDICAGLLPKRKVANAKTDDGHADTQTSAGSHDQGNEGRGKYSSCTLFGYTPLFEFFE